MEYFENVINSYFIYMIFKNFPIVKHLVYEHILDQVLSSHPISSFSDITLLTVLSQDVREEIQTFTNPLVVELKNSLPSFSITKAGQNKDPFDILPALYKVYSCRTGISEIEETNIPSPKTASPQQYILYIKHMLRHMNVLFDFYGVQTASIKWRNCVACQQRIEDRCCEYSFKWTITLRLKNALQERCLTTKPKIIKRNHKEAFEEGDRHKPPLIIYGDGLKNKNQVKYKGLRNNGNSNKLYRQLEKRELLLLDINEFRTSKICNSCLNELKYETGDKISYIHQVLVCKGCNTF